jgi:hypothetical protein
MNSYLRIIMHQMTRHFDRNEDGHQFLRDAQALNVQPQQLFLSPGF